MRSLQSYYISCLIVTLLCLLILATRKLDKRIYRSPHIVVVGCNLQAAALTNKILFELPEANITIIEQNECSNDSAFTFIKGSTFSKKLVKSINFKYVESPSTFGFWNGEALTTEDNSVMDNLFKYGLSKYALSIRLEKCKKYLRNLENKKITSIEQLFNLMGAKPHNKALDFLLYDLGLDFQYVGDILYPYLYGHYMHQIQLNQLAAQLKLLEMFSPSYEVIGLESEMIHRLLNKASLYEQEQLKEVRSSNGLLSVLTTNLNLTNISAIVYCNNSKDSKEWYYVTDLDGDINSQYYHTKTLPQSIYSKTNIGILRKNCLRCRKGMDKRYTLHTKLTLKEQHLSMFSRYQIVNTARKRVQRYGQPELGKFSDARGSYFLNHIFTVTDNRELTLSMADNVALMIVDSL